MYFTLQRNLIIFLLILSWHNKEHKKLQSQYGQNQGQYNNNPQAGSGYNGGNHPGQQPASKPQYAHKPQQGHRPQNYGQNPQYSQPPQSTQIPQPAPYDLNPPPPAVYHNSNNGANYQNQNLG